MNDKELKVQLEKSLSLMLETDLAMFANHEALSQNWQYEMHSMSNGRYKQLAELALKGLKSREQIAELQEKIKAHEWVSVGDSLPEETSPSQQVLVIYEYKDVVRNFGITHFYEGQFYDYVCKGIK